MGWNCYLSASEITVENPAVSLSIINLAKTQHNQNLSKIESVLELNETLEKSVLMCTGRTECSHLCIFAKFACIFKYLEYEFIIIDKLSCGLRIFIEGAKSYAGYLVFNTCRSKSMVPVILES